MDNTKTMLLRLGSSVAAASSSFLTVGTGTMTMFLFSHTNNPSCLMHYTFIAHFCQRHKYCCCVEYIYFEARLQGCDEHLFKSLGQETKTFGHYVAL